MLTQEEELNIRRFLLGMMQKEERERFEERLLEDAALLDHLPMAEEELIDDYLFGTLKGQERESFERIFLTTPKRREKLMLARRLKQYAENASVPGAVKQSNKAQEWLRILFLPVWKAAIFTLIVAGIGLGVWRGVFYQKPLTEVLIALNQMQDQEGGRLLEARVGGLKYSPLSVTRGPGASGSEPIALTRAGLVATEAVSKERTAETLHGLGLFYLGKGQLDEAIEQLSGAVALIDDDPQLHSDLGAALLERIKATARDGQVEKRARDIDRCTKHLNRALELDPQLLPGLFNRALLYQAGGLKRLAKDEWEKYLQLDASSGWADEVRRHLEDLNRQLQGVLHRDEEVYQRYLHAVHRDDDAAWRSYGLGYSRRGNLILDRMLDDYINAKLSNRQGDAAEHLKKMFRLGKLLERRTGDRYVSDLAVCYQKLSLENLRLAERARELMRVAHNCISRAKNDDAIRYYEQAKHRFDRLGITGESALAESLIAYYVLQRDDVDDGASRIKSIKSKLSSLQYVWLLTLMTCSEGYVHDSSADFAKTVMAGQNCHALSERVGDPLGVLRSKVVIGNGYYNLGKYKDILRIAWDGIDQSEESFAEISDEIGFYQIIGYSLGSLGLLAGAVSYRREALAMAVAKQSPRLLSRCYIQLGDTLWKQKSYQAAIDNIERGIDIGLKDKGEKVKQEFVHFGLLSLGYLYLEIGKHQASMDAFNQAVGFFENNGQITYLHQAMRGRLLTLIAMGDIESGKQELEKVISLDESYRHRILQESYRNTFFDKEQDIYDAAIDLTYTKLNDPRRAFDYAEMSRARSLLDARRQGRELVYEQNGVEIKLAGSSLPHGSAKLQSQIPEQVQLIAYTMLKDKLIVWLIESHKFESRVIPISESALTTKIEEYLRYIHHPTEPASTEWQKPSAEIYNILISPIQDLLNKRYLVIIPDKILALLPFVTLMSPSTRRILLDDYSIAYASSVNIFIDSTNEAKSKESMPSENLLIVGNPSFDRQRFPGLADLPDSAREAYISATFYKQNSILVESRATVNAVKRMIRQANIAHFAAHYLPQPGAAMLSSLLLTPEGDTRELQVYELYGVDMRNLHLVVLSACSTYGEDYYRGEGVVGITRPFEAARVPLVVASLWPIETKNTADLMISFHRYRTVGKLTSVEALRQSQLEIWQGRRSYRHPYFWAAFVAVGGFCRF